VQPPASNASDASAASAASGNPAERDLLDLLADVRSESIATASPGYPTTVALIFSLRLPVIAGFSWWGHWSASA